MNELVSVPTETAPPARVYNFKEYKVVCIREYPPERCGLTCAEPGDVETYWRQVIAKATHYNPEVESLYVILLNTRRKVKGHALVAIGTLDTILAHAREVFRPAIVAAAHAVILCYNHPSGDPAPSEGDIKVTRDMQRAGQLLRIELLDHVVIGQSTPEHPQSYCSLRETGYMAL